MANFGKYTYSRPVAEDGGASAPSPAPRPSAPGLGKPMGAQAQGRPGTADPDVTTTMPKVPEPPRAAGPAAVPPQAPPASSPASGGTDKGGRRLPFGRKAPAGPAFAAERRTDTSASDRYRRRLTLACGVMGFVAVLSVGVGAAELATASSLNERVLGQSRTVVTLTQDVPAGTTITDAMVSMGQVPSASSPVDAATDAAQVVGMRALVNMTSGNAVSTGSLVGSEDATELDMAVSDGHVAYMVSISGAAAASPMVKPGDRVNIMSGGGGQQGQVLAEDVRVLAVGSKLTDDGASEDYGTMTFELTPEEANKVFELTEVTGGAIHLVIPPKQSAQTTGAAPAQQPTTTQPVQEPGANAADTGAAETSGAM